MMLSKLEHLLLSTLCNGREPLHALYADAVREIPGTTVEQVIEALLRLLTVGLARCYFYNETTGRYESCSSASREVLLQHCAGRSQGELRQWPAERFGGEYFFEITEEGQREENRGIYNQYYSEAGV